MPEVQILIPKEKHCLITDEMMCGFTDEVRTKVATAAGEPEENILVRWPQPDLFSEGADDLEVRVLITEAGYVPNNHTGPITDAVTALLDSSSTIPPEFVKRSCWVIAAQGKYQPAG